MSLSFTRRALLAALATPVLAKTAKKLFDGRTLDGWTRHGGGIWTVENGEIVGRFDRANPGAGYLMSAGEYQDFLFELEFWIDAGANSGVFIREPRQEWTSKGEQRPALGDPAGYEVQIQYLDPSQPTGMIYGLQMPRKVVGADEQWVAMAIDCRGPVTMVRVNGEVVNIFEKTKIQKGVVGLQVHGGKPHDHVVRFRNLRIAL